MRVTAADRQLDLDPARDYRIMLPRSPLVGLGGLSITGGRNVVLIGGHIRVPFAGPNPDASSRRGLLLKDQRGVVHVEGIEIDGADLSDGINLDQRFGATVQLQNIRIEGVHARDQVGFTDNHPDVLQSYAGPRVLRVDRLTGSTDYQGFFLDPQDVTAQAPAQRTDLRHVNLRGTVRCTCVLFWYRSDAPAYVRDIWLTPNRRMSLRRSIRSRVRGVRGHVRKGRPPGGDFVPRGRAGVGYRSPGYGR